MCGCNCGDKWEEIRSIAIVIAIASLFALYMTYKHNEKLDAIKAGLVQDAVTGYWVKP